MSEKVDLDLARKLLHEVASEARLFEPHGAWVDLIGDLTAACRKGNATMIAALGTALLAKAVNLNIDPFSLKAESGPRGYSARTLCKEVLAAEASVLGIDLGVTGREPLNNSPFFREARITPTLSVKKNRRWVLEKLLKCLEAVDAIKTSREAREALSTFLQLRARRRAQRDIREDAGDYLSVAELIDLIKRFAAADPENGKRAQAIASGLQDAMVGEERVRVGRVNDPSVHFPGDVAVLRPNAAGVERVFEVRDKQVSHADIRIILDAVLRTEIRVVGVLAVARDQPPFDDEILAHDADCRSMELRLFTEWKQFVEETLFWNNRGRRTIGIAYRRIIARAEQLEVSEDGLAMLYAVTASGSSE